MDKRIKAAMAGLAFVAGCEIGIALQLVKMIHNYTVKEAASKEPIEDVIKKSEIPDDPETETDAHTDPGSGGPDGSAAFRAGGGGTAVPAVPDSLWDHRL